MIERPTHPCPKCGNDAPQTGALRRPVWCGPSYSAERDVDADRLVFVKTEGLVWECSRCQYTIETPCQDAK